GRRGVELELRLAADLAVLADVRRGEVEPGQGGGRRLPRGCDTRGPLGDTERRPPRRRMSCREHGSVKLLVAGDRGVPDDLGRSRGIVHGIDAVASCHAFATDNDARDHGGGFFQVGHPNTTGSELGERNATPWMYGGSASGSSRRLGNRSSTRLTATLVSIRA